MAMAAEPDTIGSESASNEQDVCTVSARRTCAARRTTPKQMEVIVDLLRSWSGIVDIVPRDQSLDPDPETCSSDDASSLSTESEAPPMLPHSVISKVHMEEPISSVAKVSFWVGISVALGTLACFDMLMRDVAYNRDEHCISHVGKKTYKYLARPGGWLSMWGRLGDFILAYYLWGVALYIFELYGIDHVAILKQSPLVSRSKTATLEGAAKAMIIWSIGRHVFVEVSECDAALVWLRPVGSWCLAVTYAALIAHVLYMMGCTVPRLMLGVLASPFSANGPQSIDHFTGNWLCSFVKPIQSVGYAMCLYTTGHILWEDHNGVCYEKFYEPAVVSMAILCFGNAVRMLQVLRQYYDSGKLHPHLTNAFKFFLGLCVTLGSNLHQDLAYRWLWNTLMLVSIVYAFLWDVTMVWGLLETKRNLLCVPCGSVRIRPHRLFSTRKTPYILAMVINLLFRITWVYTLVPLGNLESMSDMEFMSGWKKFLRIVYFLSPSVEVIRRVLWSVLMMEYQWLDTLEKAGNRGAMELVRAMSQRRCNLAKTAVGGRYFKVELFIALVLVVGVPILIVVTTSF